MHLQEQEPFLSSVCGQEPFMKESHATHPRGDACPAFRQEEMSRGVFLRWSLLDCLHLQTVFPTKWRIWGDPSWSPSWSPSKACMYRRFLKSQFLHPLHLPGDPTALCWSQITDQKNRAYGSEIMCLITRANKWPALYANPAGLILEPQFTLPHCP